MKYTVYGIVFESNYCFTYFHSCSDLLPIDMYVEVNINPSANIPSVREFGIDWFEISQPDTVMYRYVGKTLHILAKNEDCIKATISTVPFFLPVAQKGGVLFHASCVISKFRGKAAIIAAPSGVGKSTISTYLSMRYEDTFQIISDDAIAVYLQNGIPYVYTGPTFSKIDATAADLIGTTVYEKNYDDSKFLVSHSCNMSNICNNIEEMKTELGAFFFVVPIPISENIQTKKLDNRSMATFIKTSIVANRYNLTDINVILSDRAVLIANKISSYILSYPHKAESLNIQLCEAIHEKI